MGPDLTALYNKALGHFGQRPITSPTDGSLQSAVLNRIWPTSRQSVLSLKDWSCSTVTAALVVLDDATFYLPDGWAYGYTYPSMCLAFWKVLNGVAASDYRYDNDFPGSSLQKNLETGDPYEVGYDATLNAKVIFTNTESAIGRYSHDLADTTLYSPSLVDVMALRLAADAAPSLVADLTIVDSLVRKYNIQASEAQRLTSSEYKANQPSGGGLIDSRG